MQFLSKESLECILPNYKNLFFTIGNIREEAKKNSISQEAYEHFPYSNVISILGERGSGKTTVFSSLREILRNSSNGVEEFTKDVELQKFIYEKDLHLKIIVPEMIEEGTDLLGIILLNIYDILKKRKDEIDLFYKKSEEKSRQRGYESCIFTDKNEIDELWDKVFSTYLMRKEGFSEIAKENYSTMSEYANERQKSLLSEIELNQGIHKLFSKLSEVFSNENEKSLIYIYIDDADINQERCAEVINTILRYLKHQSVVILISGDIKKLEKEMLFFELKNESMSKTNFERVFDSLEKNKEEYVYELLKKVLPYSNRFYLENLSNEQKRKLKYPKKDDGNTFDDILKKAFFSGREDEYSLQMIDSVFGIFDYKPRGIISIWDFIEKSFSNQSERKVHIYNALVSNIINTNELLKEQEETIINCIVFRNVLGKVALEVKYELFINYITSKLNVYFSQNVNEEIEDKMRLQKALIEIVHLFYFCEQIVGERENLSGNYYSDMLNNIIGVSQEKRVYFNTMNATNVIAFYSQLVNVLEIRQQEEIFNNSTYFESYKQVIDRLTKRRKINLRGDYEWYINFNNTKNNYNNGYGKCIEQIINLTTGLEFDQQLLNVERTIQELNSNYNEGPNRNTFINRDDNKIEEALKEIRNALLAKRVWESSKESFMVSTDQFEDFNEKKMWGEVDNQQFVMTSILSREILDDLKYYVSISEYTFLANFRYDLQGKSSKDMIKMLITLKKYAMEKSRKYYYYDKATCTNIKNRVSNNAIKFSVQSNLRNYIESIIENLEHKSNNLSELLEIIKKSSPTKSNEENIFEVYSNNRAHLFFENRHEIENSGLIYYYDEECNDKTGWYSRRRNLYLKLFELLSLTFIQIRCDELLQNYFFLNQNELFNLHNQEDIHFNCDYLDIGNSYYSWYVNNNIMNIKENVQMKIAGIKSKLLNNVEHYTVINISMSSLNSLIKIINDSDFYQEIIVIKKELEANQKIKKKDWEIFDNKFKYYIESLRNQRGMEYYLSSLEVIRNELFKEDEVIYTAQLVSDIIKTEETKIYQAEYEALILIMKDILYSPNDRR